MRAAKTTCELAENRLARRPYMIGLKICLFSPIMYQGGIEMECRDVKDLMSDYLEQYLAEPESALVTEHLADCGECRAELADLEETLRVVHGLPQQEPVFDLWDEFAPKCAEISQEMSLSFFGRMKSYLSQFFIALNEGWEIFVTAVFGRGVRTTGD